MLGVRRLFGLLALLHIRNLEELVVRLRRNDPLRRAGGLLLRRACTLMAAAVHRGLTR